MENHIPKLFIFLFMLFLIVQLPLSYSKATLGGSRRRLSEAMFVFGDSIIDNGNNVFLSNTKLDIQSLPYGIDFPLGPTGRITNGRNPGDVLSELLGIPGFLPAYLNPKTKGKRVLNGVNYASAGSGILPATGFHIGYGLPKQVEYFMNGTVPDLHSQLGSSTKLKSFLSESIFVFNTGGNDCGNNCMQTKMKGCADQTFMSMLMGNFTLHLKTIYAIGARKFVLFGVQAVGCNPSNRAKNNGKCDEVENSGAIAFNTLLKSSIAKLKHEMPGSYFVYIDTYKLMRSILDEPTPKGFKVTNETCCATSSKGMGCVVNSKPCSDRNAYVYWDGGHFTEATYKYLARTAFYSKDRTYVYPFNVRHLAGL